MLGQRKLFQRLIPGLIHALIFWGFLVLFPTIVMALIGAVDRGATLPWLGHQGWFALLVDLFATLVLVAVAAAAWIRKVQRPRRFDGSHLGEADLILGLIALIVTTLILWHAVADRRRAQRVARGLVADLECDRKRLRDGNVGGGAGADLRLGARAARRRLPRLPPPLQAPAHRDGGDQRLVRPHPRRADGWSRSTSTSRTRARCASEPRPSPT